MITGTSPKTSHIPWGSAVWHLACCRTAMRIWLSFVVQKWLLSCETIHKPKTSKKKMQTEIKLFRWFQSVIQDKKSDKKSYKALRKKNGELNDSDLAWMVKNKLEQQRRALSHLTDANLPVNPPPLKSLLLQWRTHWYHNNPSWFNPSWLLHALANKLSLCTLTLRVSCLPSLCTQRCPNRSDPRQGGVQSLSVCRSDLWAH